MRIVKRRVFHTESSSYFPKSHFSFHFIFYKIFTNQSDFFKVFFFEVCLAGMGEGSRRLVHSERFGMVKLLRSADLVDF